MLRALLRGAQRSHDQLWQACKAARSARPVPYLRGAQRSHDTDELLRYGRNSPYVHSLLMTFTSHSGSRVGVVHCGVHLLRPLINCMHVYALRLGRETAYLAVSPGAHPTHQPCLGFSLKRHKNPALTRMNFESLASYVAFILVKGIMLFNTAQTQARCEEVQVSCLQHPSPSPQTKHTTLPLEVSRAEAGAKRCSVHSCAVHNDRTISYGRHARRRAGRGLCHTCAVHNDRTILTSY